MEEEEEEEEEECPFFDLRIDFFFTRRETGLTSTVEEEEEVVGTPENRRLAIRCLLFAMAKRQQKLSREKSRRGDLPLIFSVAL